MIELVLLVCSGVIGYNIWKTKAINKNVALLETQNKKMEDALLLPPSSNLEDNIYIKHDWETTGVETIYHNAFSMGTVKVKTEVCTNCRMVHRHICEGYALAVKKQLDNIEGFYFNSIRCMDNGCKG